MGLILEFSYSILIHMRLVVIKQAANSIEDIEREGTTLKIVNHVSFHMIPTEVFKKSNQLATRFSYN